MEHPTESKEKLKRQKNRLKRLRTKVDPKF